MNTQANKRLQPTLMGPNAAERMDARELLLGRSPNAVERMDARELPLPPVAGGT